MNRSFSPSLCFCIAVVVALPALAQTPRAGIPAAAKEAADPTQHRQDIESFVRSQVEQLQRADDPAAQAAARDALVNETLHNAEPAPVPFLNYYANVVNQALIDQIVGHEKMRVRLLGAIVAARVAERSDNAQLRPAAERFLADEEQAVVLWGVKTAGAVMPAVMRNPMWVGNNPLTEPVVAAVKRHSTGPIVQEAYAAFMMRIVAQPPQPANQAVIQATIEPLHQIFALRIEQYRANTLEEPLVENRVTLFLTEQGRVWPAQNEAQRTQTVQLTTDLLWLTSHRAAAHQEERERLIAVVQQCGRALWVLAQTRQDAQLEHWATEATRAQRNDPPGVLRERADNVHAAVRNAFNGVRPPQTESPSEDGAAVLTGSN